MKKLLFLVLLLSNFLGFAQQYTLIPDVNFEKALINLGIDNGAIDGKLLTTNAKKATSLRVNGAAIRDLTGIQDFENIVTLACRANLLTELDLSKNTLLQELFCDDNKLTTLDLSNNKNLVFLNCGGNLLSNLDLSQQPSLTTLYCDVNQLKILDISTNTELLLLYCLSNQLINLDVSKNLKLRYISCSNNPVDNLDLSNNKNLEGIVTANTLLKNINLKNGNNSKITNFDLRNNSNLDCIQIDDKAFSDANWSSKKDATASYSEKCSKTAAAVAPPIITAIGNQTYCPGTILKIVETVSITNDPAEPDTDAIYIQVSSGYVNGQDNLTLTNPTLHSKITTSWDSAAGKLKLYSPTGVKILYTDFVSAIKDVVFTNSTSNPTGIRNFSITIGQANFLPSTGHYYQYVSKIGITWSAARADANTLNYYGLKGYLATISSREEVQISGEQAQGAGWIGGTDEGAEGTWKWVTGPEGLANGGTGITFWNGPANGSTPNFAFWNNNEPNQFMGREEDYAHITAPSVGTSGSWNDMTNTGDISGNYQPKGFIVEYGGMPGDPDLQISGSTQMKMSQLTITTPSTICTGEQTTLQASSTSSTLNWYDAATGGTLLQTGNTYVTPILTTTTTYYVDNGCSTRSPLTVNVNPLPSLPIINVASTSPVLYCQNATAIPLSATASANCKLNWYTVATGGTPSATNPTPLTTTAGSTTYYVSQTSLLTNCESPRAAIIVTVNPLPTIPAVSNISYCNNESTSALSATASANCVLNWYSTATGGASSTTSPTPSSATVGTTSYYVSQTISATGCEGPRAEIIVTVNSVPNAPIVSAISYCKNETTIPLTATASTNCILNWYTSAIGGISITTSPTPTTTTAGTTNYYVSQTNTATGCEGPRSQIIVTVNPLPTVNDVAILQCDTDLIVDGKSLFNLTVKNAEISSNFNNETFTYYTSLNGANTALSADLIANQLAFENTISTNMDVWSRVSNTLTGCFSVAKITLKVPATNIPPSYKIPFAPVCDDFLDANGNNTINNNKRDGIASFDFSSTEAIIRAQLPTSQTYAIKYYKNESDALAELNVITDISNYRNIGYPNKQDIWIRIDSDLDNACYGLGPYLTLNVEALPIATTVTIPRQCDDNQDGIFTFDTATLQNVLLNGQNNVTVSYFDQNNNPLPSPFPASFTTKTQTITAVVTNNTTQKCFDETKIVFVVDILPQAFAVAPTLTITCDDEPDPVNQDGKFAFDTAAFQNTILGAQTGMTVSYFDQNNFPLPSPLPNPFITSTQTVTAKVENPLNTNCSATTVLNFVVNPVPNIDLNTDGNDNELVCSNLSTFFVTLDAGIFDGSPTTNYKYVWKKDVLTTGTNSPTLEVNAEGLYTVEVTNSLGCSRIRTIIVTASNVATIASVDVVDLADQNTITINLSRAGDYQFSLDEPNGFWQDSNFFDNVAAGIHEVYVNDKNGCGTVQKEVVVMGIPKFFTPNGDSYNDVWEIKGVSKYPQATVQIFDRYGKYLFTLNAINKSWNGTFNGTPLPANDYWYILNLENGKPEIKGHFSLKR